MIKLVTTIGAVMGVLGFIASAVGAFPLADVSAAPIDENTPFSADVVQQTTGQIGGMYTSIVDDLMSFQDDPDLARAEAHRNAMTAYAEDLAGRFQLFANDLQTQLDDVTEAPLPPTGLTAVPGDGQVTLDWNDNPEADLDYYNVYRSTSAAGPFTLYAGGMTASTFIDGGAANGTTYVYAVTAVNESAVESPGSGVVSATPQG